MAAKVEQCVSVLEESNRAHTHWLWGTTWDLHNATVYLGAGSGTVEQPCNNRFDEHAHAGDRMCTLDIVYAGPEGAPHRSTGREL